MTSTVKGTFSGTAGEAVILDTNANIVVNSVAYEKMTLATAVATTSGTSIDFTGIPSWVKRITVMFSGVSLNSSGEFLIQIGTGGSPSSTGYDAALIVGTNASANTVNASTTGFPFYTGATSYVVSGSMIITNISGNTWIESGVFSNSTAIPFITSCAGTKTLSGVLNMVRITTTTGTDVFDAGSVNILYEGY